MSIHPSIHPHTHTLSLSLSWHVTCVCVCVSVHLSIHPSTHTHTHAYTHARAHTHTQGGQHSAHANQYYCQRSAMQSLQLLRECQRRWEAGIPSDTTLFPQPICPYLRCVCVCVCVCSGMCTNEQHDACVYACVSHAHARSRSLTHTCRCRRHSGSSTKL